MGKRKWGTCCYCGQIGVITRDHIIPRGMFPSPGPTNLITAPACRDCNQGFSLDEEYFRACVLAGKSYENPIGRKVWDTRVRSSLSRKPAFKALLASQLTGLVVKLPGSSAPWPVFSADPPRIEAVVQKIVRGLYFRHQGTILGDVPWSIAFEALDANQELGETRDLWMSLNGGSPGGSAFIYRFGIAADNYSASIWWLLFYNSVLFTVVTGVGDEGEAASLT